MTINFLFFCRMIYKAFFFWKANEHCCFPCDLGGTQTHDFQNRNLTFYSTELRGHIFRLQK